MRRNPCSHATMKARFHTTFFHQGGGKGFNNLYINSWPSREQKSGEEMA